MFLGVYVCACFVHVCAYLKCAYVYSWATHAYPMYVHAHTCPETLIHFFLFFLAPTPSSFKVVSLCTTLPTMEIVDKLIDPTTRSWQASLNDQIFLPHEAEVIKSIPLSDRLVHDIQT